MLSLQKPAAECTEAARTALFSSSVDANHVGLAPVKRNETAPSKINYFVHVFSIGKVSPRNVGKFYQKSRT